MFDDIKVFIMLWCIVLFMFTSIGILLFTELEGVNEFKDGIVFWINCALGNWDIEIFDYYLTSLPERPLLRQIGIWLVIACVFINVLILLNVVIAMMADTYALMSSMRKGVYNYNIVKLYSSYKIDKYFGGLIINWPPVFIVSFLLLPFYMIYRNNKKMLLKINKHLFSIVYCILLIPLSGIFIIFNMLMLPFAFLKTLIHKGILASQSRISFASFAGYFILGIPLLLVSQLIDLWGFAKSSHTSRKIY